MHRQDSISRRHLLQRGAAFTLGFGGLQALLARSASGRTLGSVLVQDAGAKGIALGGPRAPRTSDGLVQDPSKIIDLPEGFAYSIISRRGSAMSDGLLVPGQPDGMAAFPGEDGLTVLIRNHELEAAWADKPKLSPWGEGNRLLKQTDRSRIYDYRAGRPCIGGTTTVLFDTKRQRVVQEFLSLAGTNRNCAGGPTPWGSWLTCEEDDVLEGTDGAEQRHGFVFEVPSSARELVVPVPIKAMGRCRHEACAVDPRTGIVYLTEDRINGLLYRYIPDVPGKLLAGGKLQAMMIDASPSCDTSNHAELVDGMPQGTNRPKIHVGEPLRVRWVDLEEIEAPKDDLRDRGFAAGAARFARCEGMWWGEGVVYFAATLGGRMLKGQVWRYKPSADEGAAAERDNPGELTLFVEPDDGHVVENADNVTVAPWGDLFVCEDAATQDVDPGNRLLRITPQGLVRTFARNVVSESEFAGACFSPDGSTLFTNLQGNGVTLAITGPWAGVRG